MEVRNHWVIWKYIFKEIILWNEKYNFNICTNKILRGNIIKVVYFDEEATQDYLDIVNGGRFD